LDNDSIDSIMSDSNNIIEAINQLLPQTQCTRCGYPSCRDYAKAIAIDGAKINQCPPGKDEGIKAIAQLLNQPPLELNTIHGEIKPKEVVVIDEDVCIGCTLCIKACPVDAIIGSNKMMHTIIATECTGCELCIPVCPVDCISLIVDESAKWSEDRRSLALERYQQHNLRKQQERQDREERLAQRKNINMLDNILAKAMQQQSQEKEQQSQEKEQQSQEKEHSD
jgi:Na+-translocating ferredoxin:NAD+ oxidoreductase subunit B